MQLLERLRRADKRENVIIISARDSLEDKVLGLKEGADDYEVCRYMQLENGLHADVYALEIIIPVAFRVNTYNIMSGSLGGRPFRCAANP